MPTTLQKLLLDNRCEVRLTGSEVFAIAAKYHLEAKLVKNPADHPMWAKLYYGEQPKKAKDHLAKLAKDFPTQAALFAPAVDEMLTDMGKAEADRLEKKAAMQKRRDDRTAKAAKKKELGVNLKAKGGEFASEETYLAMRAGLKPIEIQLRQHLTKAYTTIFEECVTKLTAAGWIGSFAYPEYDRRTGKFITTVMGDTPPLFWKLFDTDHSTAVRYTIHIRKDIAPADVIANEAARDADGALAGFCAKMAGKIDREFKELCEGKPLKGKVEDVSCSGNMWENSIVTVRTNLGTQVWHTQVIWNQSVLGKQFNQWPTRRIS